jgi:hypothetical protein
MTHTRLTRLRITIKSRPTSVEKMKRYLGSNGVTLTRGFLVCRGE